MKTDEKDLLLKLSKGDSRAFTFLFHRYYRDLVLFAGTYIPDLAVCEDIVQAIFIKLWNAKGEAPQIQSLKSFLLKSVQNSSISHLRHQNIQNKYAGLTTISATTISHETEEYILWSELNTRLQEALTHLTPVQRQCFEMNRLQGIKQARIAEELHIPLRTVELRIAESLKILKQHLKEYFILAVLFLFR